MSVAYPIRPKRDIWRTCIHESAHAVLFTVLCSGCQYIDRIETDERFGYTMTVPYTFTKEKDRLCWIASMYAGLAAEGIMLHLPFGEQPCDVAAAEKVLAGDGVSDEYRIEMRLQGFYHASRYVAEYAKQIKEVAQELFDSPTQRVEGSRVREIVERGR